MKKKSAIYIIHKRKIIARTNLSKLLLLKYYLKKSYYFRKIKLQY